MKTKLTRNDLDRLYPVRQATHTGKYGWRRVAGALNLNACRWASEKEAILDRDQANEQDDLGSR